MAIQLGAGVERVGELIQLGGEALTIFEETLFDEGHVADLGNARQVFATWRRAC
jgi:hypothetical protein